MEKTIAMFLTVSVLITLLVTGCGPGGQQIKIGIAGPLTGEQGKAGQDLLHGVQLAVSECNDRGGVLGKRVVIIAGDDRADEREAQNIAQCLCDQGVAGVIGHYNSHCSISSSRIYNQRGIPQITPSSTNPKFTEQGFVNVFRTCGRDDQQGRIAADYAFNTLKVKKVAVFSDGTTYGQGLVEEFKKSILLNNKPKKIEVTIVAEARIPVITEGKAPDYGPLLDPLISYQPDLIYFGGSYPEGARLIRQVKERRLAAAFMSGDAIASSELIKRGGAATEGIYFTFGPAVEEMPQAGRFYGSFKARYGELGPYSVYAYDAANVLLKSIKLAGTTNGDSLIKVIHSAKFAGAMGELEFDSAGDIKTAPYVLWTVKGGEFGPVKMQNDKKVE
ncbi:branched-chain amino acid ABC transporter substrate-binding protein [candidate division TA06 bacterium]|uniref:Branched-chain amino acid ABC transporter substrate-binding protein n=1 Tax=candidate division TA06 bacterium TaxID=2250710 RepID=A0A933MK87_UNCT6|nr:branched-chain amino acid ABC transporter substrate-binding protein [candidate division TA06 bacterium]